MHFALALWQMSSATIQEPVLISLFSLETESWKGKTWRNILCEQVAICQADPKKKKKTTPEE